MDRRKNKITETSFKRWMEKQSNVDHVGKVAIFYLPSEKLTKRVRDKLHEFFMSRYSAYTHESSEIRGYWSYQDKLFKDKHERYEVSFKGDEKFKEFVLFLSELCDMTNEESIYMSIGEESYLIKP